MTLTSKEFIAQILLFALKQQEFAVKFQATSEWQKSGREFRKKPLMSTNKHVRQKSIQMSEQIQRFLKESSGMFREEDFDQQNLKLLQGLDESQTKTALAHLLEMMNKYDPRSAGKVIRKWTGALLRNGSKTTLNATESSSLPIQHRRGG